MKKYLILLLMLVLLLTGCASRGEKPEEGLAVVCTVFPCYDFARAVVGDLGTVTMLISPGSEAHNYDPSPSDILKIRNCDLFVCIGGTSEAWAESILASLDADVQVVRLMDSVETMETDHGDGTVLEEHEHHHDDTELDEHIWTSPRNAICMLDALTDALCAVEAEHSDVLRANAQVYRAQLESLDADFAAAVAAGVRNKVVFGDRFPFAYLAHTYGLECAAAFPGCSSASEPSVSTVAALVRTVQEEKIPVVFKLEMSNGHLADTLAEETGAQVLEFHSCHNVTAEEFAAEETYVSLMRKNLAALTVALQ